LAYINNEAMPHFNFGSTHSPPPNHLLELRRSI